MNWKNMQVSIHIQANYRNDSSADFGKIPGKQPWWSPILVQFQALQLY